MWFSTDLIESSESSTVTSDNSLRPTQTHPPFAVKGHLAEQGPHILAVVATFALKTFLLTLAPSEDTPQLPGTVAKKVTERVEIHLKNCSHFRSTDFLSKKLVNNQ